MYLNTLNRASSRLANLPQASLAHTFAVDGLTTALNGI